MLLGDTPAPILSFDDALLVVVIVAVGGVSTNVHTGAAPPASSAVDQSKFQLEGINEGFVATAEVSRADQHAKPAVKEQM